MSNNQLLLKNSRTNDKTYKNSLEKAYLRKAKDVTQNHPKSKTRPLGPFSEWPRKKQRLSVRLDFEGDLRRRAFE